MKRKIISLVLLINIEIFAQIFRDLAQIFDKSKLLGVRFHPLHPRLLHHCPGSYTTS